MKRILPLGCAWLMFAGAASPTLPEEAANHLVPLAEGKPYPHVVHEGRSVRVQRVQDPKLELTGYDAKTARKCPPFCIHPMSAAPGGSTIGEVELFEVMEGALRDGTGLLIDARTSAWYKKGTIPGAASYPFTRFFNPPGDPEWDEILPGLGARPSQEPGVVEETLGSLGLVAKNRLRSGKWDFSGAKDLVVFRSRLRPVAADDQRPACRRLSAREAAPLSRRNADLGAVGAHDGRAGAISVWPVPWGNDG